MPLKPTKHIWFNNKLVPWEEAQIHVLSYALHYGAAVFEGIRAYSTNDGTRIFRLEDHIKRLFNSAKIYRMNMAFDSNQIMDACRTVVVSNELNNGAYIRPIAFRGYNDLGLHASLDDDIEVVVAAWKWGPYLGKESAKSGVDVCVSSWNKIAPNTIPVMAKASGNYLSGTLVAIEAKE
ncbi:MAG: aminotransferase class IV, partial [Gammaproteobacteria bacterium]|nr:aminotransferase class IV [Gammaproteobacteria bacterium]